MTHEDFLKWLDEEIEFLNPDTTPAEYDRGYRRALMEVKKQFLTLTPPPTTLN